MKERKLLVLGLTVLLASISVSCGSDEGGGALEKLFGDSGGNMFGNLPEGTVAFNGNKATQQPNPTKLSTTALLLPEFEDIPQYIDEDGNSADSIVVDSENLPEGVTPNPEYESAVDLREWEKINLEKQNPIDADQKIPEEDYELYGEFTHKKFVKNNTVIKLYSLPQEPKRLNYVFTGWNTKADGLGDPVGIGYKLADKKKSITVYAQWAQDAANQVSFQPGLQARTLTQPGYYLFELWGGQGWTPQEDTSKGGKGAYVRGIYEVTEADISAGRNVLYFSASGQGTDGQQKWGGAGFNGSGNNEGAGGGSTDVRYGGRTIYDRILVAGGGGGANDRNQTGNIKPGGFWAGGYATGITAESGSTSSGQGGNSEGTNWAGSGATIERYGQSYNGNSNNRIPATFYFGGTYIGVSESAGGGGGGYFGGGAGGQDRTNGGGGGGSSFMSGHPGFTSITGPMTYYATEEGGSRLIDDSGNKKARENYKYIVGDTEYGDWSEVLKTGADGSKLAKQTITVYENPNATRQVLDDSGNPVLTDPNLPFDEESNPYLTESAAIPHLLEIVRYASNTKAVHYSGKVFIDEITLFKGEAGLEVTYTSTVKGGNELLPLTNGEGSEVGHTGEGYARFTYLGDGIIHEVEELAVPDEDFE
ncbi:MAG: hypothetical protein Ta2F_02320 [Termitinemataceae bacterium]|nr:MAG: hypothetical protein Ta2F_02320 [Termitinemataceae bacterium]